MPASGGSGSGDAPQLSPYELRRLANIKRNEGLMRDLGLLGHGTLTSAKKTTKPKKRPTSAAAPRFQKGEYCEKLSTEIVRVESFEDEETRRLQRNLQTKRIKEVVPVNRDAGKQLVEVRCGGAWGDAGEGGVCHRALVRYHDGWKMVVVLELEKPGIRAKLCRLILCYLTNQKLDVCADCAGDGALTECSSCFRSFCAPCLGAEQHASALRSDSWSCRQCDAVQSLADCCQASCAATDKGSPIFRIEREMLVVETAGCKQVFCVGQFAYLDSIGFEPYMREPSRLAEVLHNNDLQQRKIVRFDGFRSVLQKNEQTGLIHLSSRPQVRHWPLPARREFPEAEQWRQQHHKREEQVRLFLAESSDNFYYTQTLAVLSGKTDGPTRHDDICFIDESVEELDWTLDRPVRVGNVFCGSGGMAAGVHLANRGFRIGQTQSKPLSLDWACDVGENQLRSFFYNHGEHAPHLFHGHVQSLVAALASAEETAPNSLKPEVQKTIMETDLLLLEPPCQNYSRKNRSNDPFRFSDAHANISALWSSLTLWGLIMPAGLNFENVEGINHFKSIPEGTNEPRPLLCRVLGKLLLKGANVQLSGKESTAECGVGSGRFRMILQATLGTRLPEQHVRVAAVQGSGIWECMEEPSKLRWLYWRPKDGAAACIDDVDSAPGSPPWSKRKESHYVGDPCHCTDSRTKRPFAAKIVRMHKESGMCDVVYRSWGCIGLLEKGVALSRIKPCPLIKNFPTLGAAQVAADLLHHVPAQRPLLGFDCDGLAVVRCRLQHVDEVDSAADDVYREVREQLRDTGGVVEHEASQIYTFASRSDIRYKYDAIHAESDAEKSDSVNECSAWTKIGDLQEGDFLWRKPRAGERGFLCCVLAVDLGHSLLEVHMYNTVAKARRGGWLPVWDSGTEETPKECWGPRPNTDEMIAKWTMIEPYANFVHVALKLSDLKQGKGGRLALPVAFHRAYCKTNSPLARDCQMAGSLHAAIGCDIKNQSASTTCLKIFSPHLPAPTVTSTMDVLDSFYGIVRSKGIVSGPTMAEAKRFQGFPDSWIFCGETLDEKMGMVADAVPPPFAFRLLETWGRRLLGEERFFWPGRLLHQKKHEKYNEFRQIFLRDEREYREERKRRWNLWREGHEVKLESLQTYHRLEAWTAPSAPNCQQERRRTHRRSSTTIRAVMPEIMTRAQAEKQGYVLSKRSTKRKSVCLGASSQRRGGKMPKIDASFIGTEIEFKYREGWFAGKVLQVADGSNQFEVHNIMSGTVPKGHVEVLYEDGDRDWVELRGPPFFNAASTIPGAWRRRAEAD